MREHSLRRAEVDWPVLREQALEYARGATTPAEAHLAVRFAVRALGDRHSYLQSPAVTRELQTTAVANARTGAALAAPRARRFANVAHLLVPSFAGGTPVQQVEFAESLKNIIQQHDEAGVCGWVVDLRQNTGGNLWPMLAGLGPCSRRASSRHPSTPTAGGSPSGTATVKPGSATTRSCECARRIECGRPRRSRCCLGPLRPAPPRCWPLRCAVAPRRARSARPRGA